MPKPRVVIPTNPKDLLELGKKVYNRHASANGQSVLGALKWEEIANKIDQGLELHHQAEELRRQMEKTYQQRDAIVEEVENLVKRSRDVLSGVYRDDMKVLGDYGFDVINSPRSKAKTEEEK